MMRTPKVPWRAPWRRVLIRRDTYIGVVVGVYLVAGAGVFLPSLNEKSLDLLCD